MAANSGAELLEAVMAAHTQVSLEAGSRDLEKLKIVHNTNSNDN